MNKRIKIQFSGEEFEMTSALVSGREDDSPISLYCGRLDLDEIHSALYYANRTVVRLLCDEFGVEFDDVDNFLLSALSECMTKEFNARTKGEDLGIRKKIRYTDNQN